MPVPWSWRPPRRAPWIVYTPVITWTVVIAYTALGYGMAAQPLRFERTPSYHNLLILAQAPVWGAAYLFAAGLLTTWRVLGKRWIGVLGHTFAIILTVWWLGAFVIRYATDDATTIVNVVSWSVFLSLAVRSSSGLDGEAGE